MNINLKLTWYRHSAFVKIFFFKKIWLGWQQFFWRQYCNLENNVATVLESLLYEITFLNRESLEHDKKILCIILDYKTNNRSENDWSNICTNVYFPLTSSLGRHQPQQISNPKNWVKLWHHGQNFILQWQHFNLKYML